MKTAWCFPTFKPHHSARMSVSEHGAVLSTSPMPFAPSLDLASYVSPMFCLVACWGLNAGLYPFLANTPLLTCISSFGASLTVSV